MAKTLRVRTASGWVTKPAADIEANKLTAEEVDDNFLAMEDKINAITAFETGYVLLVAKRTAITMTGWTRLDYDAPRYDMVWVVKD